jgi:hypothetical protein
LRRRRRRRRRKKERKANKISATYTSSMISS